MGANASIIIHGLKLRLHWSPGLGLIQCGAVWGTGGKFVFKANKHRKAAGEGDVRVILEPRVFFPTQSLICSLSPRFLSMHCCYRFREGEKMHHACRSKVCWILNTAELWGARWRNCCRCFSNKTELHQWARLSIDMHLLFLMLEVKYEMWIWTYMYCGSNAADLTCGGALCSLCLCPSATVRCAH